MISSSKVLGFTKNNDKYVNVPDSLKWAIPIHEAVTSPESLAKAKAVEDRVKRELAAEAKANLGASLSSMPKP